MKIDGKQIANKIFLDLKERVKKLKEKNITPHLAIILVDRDPASIAYINQKKLKGQIIGAKISIHQLSHSVTEKFVLRLLNDLNHLTSVHGIIVQRPLPKAIDKNKISLAIDPNKDVDGFHPASYFQPPIALAVLRILEEISSQNLSPRHSGEEERRLQNLLATEKNGRDSGHGQNDDFTKWLSSKKIVVIGKGETGGRPIIQLFKQMGIEPTVIDSKTPNPESLTKKADIIISAVGKPNVVKPEMLKREVILIGVGLYKGSDGKLHGDYEDEKIKDIASLYTPTPGGVGPVNVACLLENVVKAAENSK